MANRFFISFCFLLACVFTTSLASLRPKKGDGAYYYNTGATEFIYEGYGGSLRVNGQITPEILNKIEELAISNGYTGQGNTENQRIIINGHNFIPNNAALHHQPLVPPPVKKAQKVALNNAKAKLSVTKDKKPPKKN